MVWIVLVLSLLAGVLYRMGGYGPPFNTKVRDFGCPLIACLTLALLGYGHWTLILVFGLMFGAMTTYWKKKGTDGTWVSWALTGLGYSLSVLPVVIAYGLWGGFVLRLLACTILTTLWSLAISNDHAEESGRGFINNATLALLLV